MAFTLPTPPTPASIGEITVEIFDPDGTNPNRAIRGYIETLSAEGQPAGNWNGNLLPHMPQVHVTALIAIMDWLRAEAEDKLIP